VPIISASLSLLLQPPPMLFAAPIADDSHVILRADLWKEFRV
jgi:hypothetical protein